MTEQPFSPAARGLNPFGIKAKIQRVKGRNSWETAALAATLKPLIKKEAEAHGAPFSEENFENVVASIAEEKAQAYFLVLKKKGSALPQIVGAAILLQTVYTTCCDKNCSHHSAIYFEDTYVDPEASRLFREKTGIGLGTFFVSEIIRESANEVLESNPFGVSSDGYIGEFAQDNAAMRRIYEKLGATLDENPSNTVLEFAKTPDFSKAADGLTVNMEHLGRKTNNRSTHIYDNIFAINWPAGKDGTNIVVSFTESMSTFNGTPVVRVQVSSNGNLPSNDNLSAILGAAFQAGAAEIVEKGWIAGATKSEEIYPFFKIHAPHETNIIGTLRQMGAETRYLGHKATQPVKIGYENMPAELFGGIYSKGSPLSTISTPRTISTQPPAP